MKTKVFVSLIIFLSLLTYGNTLSAANEYVFFDDLKYSFAQDSIKHLWELGIIEGKSTNKFNPNESITRYQFSEWLAKILGITPIYPLDNYFKDFPTGTYQSGYIHSLAELGILHGSGDLNFLPSSPITRQDAAVMIFQAQNNPQEIPAGISYLDKDNISPYAVKAVSYVTNKGWMSGNNQYFNPMQELTRAEAASLLFRLFNSRKSQALTALPIISARETTLKPGEKYQIDFQTSEINTPFSTVFGSDNPTICTVDADGTMDARQIGQATVTVNKGYNFFTIAAEVLPGKYHSESIANNSVPMDYHITQHAPDTAFQQMEKKNNPGPKEGLLSQDDTWTGFLRQQGRDVLIDLRKIQSIKSVSLEFLQEPSWGVWAPEYLKAELSQDGVYWQHLGYVRSGFSDRQEGTAELALTFSPINTRYIKLSFPVDVWVFARSLTVQGVEPAKNPSALASSETITNRQPNHSMGNYGQDILLIYSGENNNTQNFKKSDFTPLVSYQERTGRIIGPMFDTLLFLPYYGMPTTKTNWSLYIEDLFSPEKQLDALNKAVDWVNKYSNLNIRGKVILSIPYPDTNQQEFGIVVANGENLNFSEASVGVNHATQNRISAVEWFYNTITEKWKNAHFDNLDLVGIYWYGESIEKNLGEKELVISTARIVRNDNLEFIWIPFYGTKGYENWSSYGFTQVYLQPNYFSRNKPPEDRMDKAAELTKKFNMNIEIELDEAVFTDELYYDLFYNQLRKGQQLGFDKMKSNAYYAGHLKRTLLKSARSHDVKIRAIYDDIYHWINGTYIPEEP